MKTLINIIIIIIAIVLQISVVYKIAIYGGYPNLILLIMLSLICINRTNEGLWWLGLGGILLELSSPMRFGIYIFPLILVFFLTHLVTKKVFSDPVLSIVCGFLLAASFLIDLPWIIINSFFTESPNQWFIVLSNAIYNTFVGCIVYVFIRYYLKPKETIKI